MQNDQILLCGDILCFSETWIKNDIVQEELKIPGYELQLNSIGEGKGIATYFKSEGNYQSIDVKNPTFQFTKLSSLEIDIINVYRSQSANNSNFLDELSTLINKDKTTIICGDFNLCLVKEKLNIVTKSILEYGFSQLVTMATHIKGGHINHVYSNHDSKLFEVDVMMHSPYYTSHDHDALFITVKRCPDLK